MPGGFARTIALADLPADVSLSVPLDGQVLAYESAGAMWKNRTLVAGQVTNAASLVAANTFTLGPNVFQSGGPGNVGLIVQGAISQTANLQEWQNSSGAVRGFIAADGTLGIRSSVPVAVNAFTVYDDTADFIQFMVGRNVASCLLFQYYVPLAASLLIANSGAGPLTFRASQYDFQFAGSIGTTVSATNGWVFPSLAAGTVPVVVKGAPSQTANLQEWRNSSDVVLAAFDSTGRLGLGTASPSYDIDTRHTGTYPANVVRFQGPSDLDALSVRVVSGTGVIWEANGGYGTLHIRSNTIALEGNDGSNIVTFIDSSMWSDHAAGSFLSRGVAAAPGGLVITPQGGPYERVQISTKGLVIASTGPQFVTTPPTGMLDVRSDSADKVALVVQGAPSQTAYLQEWKPATGQAVAAMSDAYTTGPILFLSGNTVPEFGANAINGLEVRGLICTPAGFATKTGGGYVVTANCVGDVFRFRENNITGNVPLAMDMIANRVGINCQTSFGGQLHVVASSALTTGLVVQGAPSQSANLQEWQDVSGAVLSSINSRGQFTANGAGTSVPFGGQFQIDLFGSGDTPANSLNSGIRVSSSYAGGSIPYPASIGWLLGVGAFLTPRGFAMYDSGGALLASGPSLGIGIGLNRGSPGIGVINAGGPSIRTEQGQVEVWTGVATGLGIVVKGAPSQSANLQEWQNAAGTAMAAILNNGALRPAHLADSAAANDSVYYSMDTGKLVYKDSSSVVNNLY